MAQAVFIRPLVAGDLDLLELLYEDPAEAGQFGFFGYQNPGGLSRDFAAGRLISEDHGRLAVALRGPAKTGEFIGEVSGSRPRPRSTTSPSSGPWRKQASPAKAYCADPASAPENGATWRRIPLSARTCRTADRPSGGQLSRPCGK